MPQEVVNFGREVRFRPDYLLTPRTESELIAGIDDHRGQDIRVMGAKHAWNRGIISDEVLVDLRHLNSIRIERRGGDPVVRVGGGCRLSRLLRKLNRQGLTLPSIGMVTAQTVAGATATGTHGSGKPSLSHFIQEARVVCSPEGAAEVRTIVDGDDLKAVRCSLGCLGIVAELTLPVIPQYQVEEQTVTCEDLDDAISHEAEWPLQQLFLLPHKWKWYAQRRRKVEGRPRSTTAGLYHLYWLIGLNLGFSALLRVLTSVWGGKQMLKSFYRRIATALLITNWRVVDRSDRLLVLKHELIRHLELELFVSQSSIRGALPLLIDLLSSAADVNHATSKETDAHIRKCGLGVNFERLRGAYTHDCPICLRRVLPDDTMISMSTGDEPWYAISLITYATRRETFYQFMTFVAEFFYRLYGARIHWGKWFPLGGEAVEQQYPEIDRFRECCRRFDPAGRYCNAFVSDKIGLAKKSDGDDSDLAADPANRNVSC